MAAARLPCAGALVLSAACFGCAGHSAEAVAARYRAALEARNFAAAARESSESPAQLAVAASLPGFGSFADPAALQSIELVYASGARVVLVPEDGRLRVVSGASALLGPEAALAAFLSAIRAHDLARVRLGMPAAGLARFPNDTTLAAALTELAPAVARVEQALGAASPQFETQGDRALWPYTPHRSVRLVRETGRWRVVDLD